MCGHFIGFYTYSQLQHQPRALWRCSTCGRESRAPLDCCTRPSFDASPKADVACAVTRWLQETSTRMLTLAGAVFTRRRRLAVPLSRPVGVTPDGASDADDVLPAEEEEGAAVAEGTHASV